MVAEIDLNENAAYVVIDGPLTKVLPKKFGTDEIHWKDGKVLDVVRSERHRLKGQPEI
ncbi:DUF3954 domain-containing protein [Halobacillus kuroshimensis]|uniref:DUF3954 domain-containing protein n=2 Tax=Halobacillus kuroshimensis TaxID=302481 RepID=A0ABS3DZS2_9BACI|nr:DUF3954 domain-containing protein [Halobacillus kuroshimensis]